MGNNGLLVLQPTFDSSHILLIHWSLFAGNGRFIPWHLEFNMLLTGKIGTLYKAQKHLRKLLMIAEKIHSVRFTPTSFLSHQDKMSFVL